MNHRCSCSSGTESRDINTVKKDERIPIQQGSAYRAARSTLMVSLNGGSFSDGRSHGSLFTLKTGRIL